MKARESTPPRGVVVFDIDGTLTETTAMDDAHWWAAVHAVLPELDPAPAIEFAEYTDSAMLRTLCDELDGRDYDAVRPRVLERFLERLRTAFESDPRSCAAVPGATAVFAAVRRAGWAAAIATGGWRESAELKLEWAGIPRTGVPLATSSEAPRRADLIRRAATEAFGGPHASWVYIGDGAWDVRACRELGIPFVGRAANPEAAGELRAHGARAVIADFTEVDRLLALLDRTEALVPSDGIPSAGMPR